MGPNRAVSWKRYPCRWGQDREPLNGVDDENALELSWEDPRVVPGFWPLVDAPCTRNRPLGRG